MAETKLCPECAKKSARSFLTADHFARKRL